MANLMTAGLTNSLLTAFNHAKLAEKPMMQVSNESQKRNPDMGKMQRGLSYGSDELTKSEDARNQAIKELELAAQIAHEEEKTEAEQRVAEKAAKPIEASNSVSGTSKISNDKGTATEEPALQKISKNLEDKVELSPEALKAIAENPAPKPVSDLPKVDTKAASVKSVPKPAHKEPKFDTLA